MWRILLFVLLVGCSVHDTDEYIGAGYVGTPYVASPLGETVPPDVDPLIRYDAFDCMTFVETALADGDIKKLNKIRYMNGVPSFVNRNHFVETDWLEGNSDIVVNVSAKYAPTSVRNVTIDKKKWFKKTYNIDTQFAPRNVNLEYIPYANVHDIRITEPMVVLFVIKNPMMRGKIGTDLAIHHMGFLLPDGRLRHASSLEKRVVDVDMNEYVDGLVENRDNLGIILLDIKNDKR